METIPSGAYVVIGAALGAFITFLTSWRGQRESRAQLLFKEKSDKVHQFAVDLNTTAYLFLWITWSARYEKELDQDMQAKYWDRILDLMPRLYAGEVLIAGIDKKLDKLSASLVNRADDLDEAISAELILKEGKDKSALAELHERANVFAIDITTGLSDIIKKLRSGYAVEQQKQMATAPMRMPRQDSQNSGRGPRGSTQVG
jgi:tRNA nucleotidyltransferase/poly(A) polymerase